MMSIVRALCAIFLLALVSQQKGYSQEPTNPCKKYAQEFGPGLCTSKYSTDLVIVGKGNLTTVQVSNPTDQWSVVSVILHPVVAKAANGWINHLNLLSTSKVTVDGKTFSDDVLFGESLALFVPAKAKLELTFVSPLKDCDRYGQSCTSEADSSAYPTFGSAEVWYTSALPETLDEIQAPTVTLTVGENKVSGNTPIVQKTPTPVAKTDPSADTAGKE